MNKLIHRTVAVVSLFALSVSGSIAVAGEPLKTDLNDYLCKDVMRFSGEDRELALAILHGYRLGKKNKTQFVTQELAEMTDSFIEYCLDHPGEAALGAFEKVAK